MATPKFILELREKIGHDLLWLTGITGVVLNDRAEVLLVRRADNGRWSLVAGILEPGEQPALGLVREIHEETAVDVAVERLVSVYGAATGHLSQRRPGPVPGPLLPLPPAARRAPRQRRRVPRRPLVAVGRPAAAHPQRARVDRQRPLPQPTAATTGSRRLRHLPGALRQETTAVLPFPVGAPATSHIQRIPVVAGLIGVGIAAPAPDAGRHHPAARLPRPAARQPRLATPPALPWSVTLCTRSVRRRPSGYGSGAQSRSLLWRKPVRTGSGIDSAVLAHSPSRRGRAPVTLRSGPALSGRWGW